MSAIESILIVWGGSAAIALVLVCGVRAARRIRQMRSNRKTGSWLNRYRINCGWLS